MELKTAMILAAGVGSRLKSLVTTTPKPLLPIKGKPFIVHHLERLAALKFETVVINVHYLAEQIIDTLGDGAQFGLRIIYSHEKELLGPGGAIKNALRLLGDQPFLLISGDIYTHFPFEQWLCDEWSLNNNLIYAVLTDKRPGAQGDFACHQGKLLLDPHSPFVYASIAVVNPLLFEDQALGHSSLMPAFKKAIDQGLAAGIYYADVLNINTVDEYQALQDTAGT